MSEIEPIGPENSPNNPKYYIDDVYVQDEVDLLMSLRAKNILSEYELRGMFLRRTLGKWFDGLCTGIDSGTGHLLYRLTDYLVPEERADIDIWPDPDAGQPWLTVESFRVEWENLHPEGIPELPLNELPQAFREITT